MIRPQIRNLVNHIIPLDSLETQHIQETLEWIDSGAEIYRIQKPDTPPQHLVAYFIVVDINASKILLVDHKKAQLWLPPGGHVDLNEHPYNTVVRECQEELNIQANFLVDHPLFLTVTNTVGLTADHTDVSLWYVLKGDYQQNLKFDFNEFNSIKWFDFNALPYFQSDPHLQRFMKKLIKYL